MVVLTVKWLQSSITLVQIRVTKILNTLDQDLGCQIPQVISSSIWFSPLPILSSNRSHPIVRKVNLRIKVIQDIQMTNTTN